MDKTKIKTEKKSFFILKGVDDVYGKIGNIKPLNTISKNKRLSSIKDVYSLWLYNNIPNKNFYKLGYGIKNKNNFIAVILSYPLTKNGVKKYNKAFFKKIDSLTNTEIEKIISLIQLFESNNLSKIEKIITLFIKGNISLNKIKKLFKILKPLFGKNEKNTVKLFSEINKIDQSFLNELGLNKENVFLFLVFFHDFFKLINILKIKNINEMRKVFISMLNIKIIFFKKIKFPKKNKKKIDLDQIYFEI